MRSHGLAVIWLLLFNGQSVLAAGQDFLGTWKLNVEQSRSGSQKFKAGTITIEAAVSKEGIRWTEEFFDSSGKYSAREWAGTLDGKVSAYRSPQPGTMSIRRRDERTLEISILPTGGPAVSGTCSLSPDRNHLTVTTKRVESDDVVDVWVLDRWLPSDVDLKVLRRADELLHDASDWERNVGRRCPAGSKKLSLICALQRAQIEVTGTYEHRAPSMQMVRQVVDALVENRGYEHRLGGYNDDPTTTFADIKAVLRTSIERITQQLKRD